MLVQDLVTIGVYKFAAEPTFVVVLTAKGTVRVLSPSSRLKNQQYAQISRTIHHQYNGIHPGSVLQC